MRGKCDVCGFMVMGCGSMVVVGGGVSGWVDGKVVVTVSGGVVVWRADVEVGEER